MATDVTSQRHGWNVPAIRLLTMGMRQLETAAAQIAIHRAQSLYNLLRGFNTDSEPDELSHRVDPKVVIADASHASPDQFIEERFKTAAAELVVYRARLYGPNIKSKNKHGHKSSPDKIPEDDIDHDTTLVQLAEEVPYSQVPFPKLLDLDSLPLLQFDESDNQSEPERQPTPPPRSLAEELAASGDDDSDSSSYSPELSTGNKGFPAEETAPQPSLADELAALGEEEYEELAGHTCPLSEATDHLCRDKRTTGAVSRNASCF
ncbi:hypothetical protein B0T17DRAFT_269211 [Bombardia bombarda]|uniref:Uncharacterized protein n=1 Tax=Bombardia bombarda TaxID=252184 RepID=A0AA39X112_9PEZI|nr:hypothetical protein B0T17DRAFT_269211 [Bombardia bombarda]